MPLCSYCSSTFPDNGAVRQHQKKSPICQKRWKAAREARFSQIRRTQGQADIPLLPGFSTAPVFSLDKDIEPNLEPSMTIVAEEPDVEAQCPRIEELPEEEDDGIWVESFPSNKNAGGIFGEAQTSFQSIRDDQVLRGAEIWGLFRDEDEWELAKWLIKNVGHNQAEEFLKLQAVSYDNLTDAYPRLTI